MAGIDKIVLFNFKILNFEDLPKRYTETFEEIGETFEEKNDLFDLSFSTRLKRNNELYTVATLSFNPNTILRGDNIENASVTDLIEVIERIKLELRYKNIQLETSEAKVKFIEINKNLPISFESLLEVVLAIGRANFKNAIGHYSYTEEDIPRKIRQDRGIYINLADRTILLYDKEFDVLRKYQRILGFPLTRAEVRFGRDYYREEVKKLGLSNSLEDLINNPWLLETLFKKEIEEHVIRKTDKYINEVIKNNLEKEFTSFKDNEKRKRLVRANYKKKGKEYPEDFKEIRGVFGYLEKESWIFDGGFLREIVVKNLEKKRWEENLVLINRDFLEVKNYEKFKKLSIDLAQIFLND